MAHNSNSLPVGLCSSSSFSSSQQGYHCPDTTSTLHIPTTASGYPLYALLNKCIAPNALNTVSSYRDDVEGYDDLSGSFDKMPLTVSSMTSQSTGTISPMNQEAAPSYSVGMYNGVALADGRYNSDGNRIVTLDPGGSHIAEPDSISIGSPVPLPFPSSAVTLPLMHLQQCGPFTQPTSSLPSPYVDMQQLSLQEEVPLALTLSSVYPPGTGQHKPASANSAYPSMAVHAASHSHTHSSTQQAPNIFAAIASAPTGSRTPTAPSSAIAPRTDASGAAMVAHNRSASYGFSLRDPSPALTARVPSDPAHSEHGQDSTVMRKRMLAAHASLDQSTAHSGGPASFAAADAAMGLAQRSSTPPLLSHAHSGLSQVTVDSLDSDTRAPMRPMHLLASQHGQSMSISVSGACSPASVVRVASNTDGTLRHGVSTESATGSYAQSSSMNAYSQNVAADAFSFTSTPRSAEKRRRTSYANVLTAFHGDGTSDTDENRSSVQYTPSSSPLSGPSSGGVPVAGYSVDNVATMMQGMNMQAGTQVHAHSGDFGVQTSANAVNFQLHSIQSRQHTQRTQSMQTQVRGNYYMSANVQGHNDSPHSLTINLQAPQASPGYHNDSNSPNGDAQGSIPQSSPSASDANGFSSQVSASNTQNVSMTMLQQPSAMSASGQTSPSLQAMGALNGTSTVHIAPFGACVVRPMLMNNGIVGQCVITPDGQVFVVDMNVSAVTGGTEDGTSGSSEGVGVSGESASNGANIANSPASSPVGSTSSSVESSSSLDSGQRGSYEVDCSSIDRKTNMFTQQSFMTQPFPVPLPQPATFAAKQTVQVLTYRKPVMMSPHLQQSAREKKEQNHLLPPAHPYQSVHSQTQQHGFQQGMTPFMANTNAASAGGIAGNSSQAQLITAAAQQAAQVGADQQRWHAGRGTKARLPNGKSLSNHSYNTNVSRIGGPVPVPADMAAPVIRGPDLEEAMRRKRNAREKERRDYNAQLFEHLGHVLNCIGCPVTGQKSQMNLLQHAAMTLERLANQVRAGKQRELVLEGLLNSYNIPIPDMDALIPMDAHTPNANNVNNGNGNTGVGNNSVGNNPIGNTNNGNNGVNTTNTQVFSAQQLYLAQMMQMQGQSVGNVAGAHTPLMHAKAMTPQQVQQHQQQQQSQPQQQIMHQQQQHLQQMHLHQQSGNATTAAQYAHINNFMLGDSNLLAVAGARMAVNADIAAIAGQLHGSTHITTGQQQHAQTHVASPSQSQTQAQSHVSPSVAPTLSTNHLAPPQLASNASSQSTPRHSSTNTPASAPISVPSPMVDHSSCLPPSSCPSLPPLELPLPTLAPLVLPSPISDAMLSSPSDLSMAMDIATPTADASQLSNATDSVPSSTCSSSNSPPEHASQSDAALTRGNSDPRSSAPNNGFPKLTFDQMRMLVTSLTPVNAAMASAQGRDHAFPSSKATSASFSGHASSKESSRPPLQPLITSITPTSERSASKLPLFSSAAPPQNGSELMNDSRPSLCISLSSAGPLHTDSRPALTVMPKVEEGEEEDGIARGLPTFESVDSLGMDMGMTIPNMMDS